MVFYLDPGEKHGNCHHVIELGLPEAQRLEVCILLIVGQEALEQITHRYSTVHIEHHRHIAQEDDNDVEHIPEALEVPHLVSLDLQDLFDGVVDNEQDEDALAGHHEVVEAGHVTNELHCAEGERRDTATCGRVLQHEPGEKQRKRETELRLSCS